MTKPHFINGEWHSSNSDTSTIESINPATNEIVWSGNSADQSIVDLAFASARAAFMGWAATPIEQRIAILKSYQEILKERQQELASIISNETGKMLWEAKTEAATMIGKIDLSL